MPTTQEFLEAILPAEGLKCGLAFLGERRQQRFFASAKELADWLLTEDALEATVYHGCASYKTPESRKATNVLAAKAFWLDVDAGEGKPYEDAIAAAEAVASFCGASRLPLPIFVGSGAGLHVYWPLRESLSPDEWRPYATGLKRLTREAGLQAGAERTGDIASILRPPGSHHRKAAPVIVRAGPLVGPYALRDFEALRDSVGRIQPAAGARQLRAQTPIGLNAAVADVYEPAFSDPIAEQCAQVGALKQRQGNIPEPHWYAAIGVLAFCEDGDEKAHEWSSGYPGYTEAETSAKLARAGLLSGATTCEHFSEAVDHSVCRVCPFYGRIKSPISLGKRQWTSSSQASLSEQSSSPSPSASQSSSSDSSPPFAFSPTPLSSVVNGFGVLPPLPVPFAWSTKGQLLFQKEANDGQLQNDIVSEHPIYLDSVNIGEIQTGVFNYLFKQWLPHKGWIDIMVNAGSVMAAGGIPEMFKGGAVISDRDLFKKFIVEAVNARNKVAPPSERYEQFGWKAENTEFLWGTTVYGPAGTRDVTGSEDMRARAKWLGAKGGSLGVWSEVCGELFSQPGFHPHVLALIASFGASFMRFNSETEGGAIISLVSGGSGTGKSTALEAAGSVWGWAKRGTDLTEIDTGVSKAITLATLGNLPAIFDELSRRDPEWARDFVLMFTNGRDKMRGTQDGTIRHVAASWQTLLLTASNLSLVDTLNAAGGTDAPSFRVLEFPAEMEGTAMAQARGEELRKMLFLNGGHAGAAFLKYIVQPDVSAMLPKYVQQMTRRIWEETGLSSPHRFWVRALSAVAVAGEIIDRLKLLPFSTKRTIDWALGMVMQQRDDGSTVTGNRNTAADAISQFLVEHVNTMLVVQHPARGGRGNHQIPLLKPSGPNLFVRYEKDPPMLYIAEGVFRMWAVKKGLLARSVLRDLTVSKVIRQTRLVTLGAGTDYATGQIKCIEVDAAHPMISGMLAVVSTQEEKAVSNG